jgi:hypothetical protein
MNLVACIGIGSPRTSARVSGLHAMTPAIALVVAGTEVSEGIDHRTFLGAAERIRRRSGGASQSSNGYCDESFGSMTANYARSSA